MLYLGTSWLVAVMEQTVLRDERTDYEWDRPSLIVIFLMGSSQIPLEASVSFSVTGVP